MAIQRNDNFQIAAPKPIDSRYGTYSSIAEARSAVSIFFRYQGLTVGIIESGSVVEYWWQDGTDDNQLVVKTTSSSGSTLTNIEDGSGNDLTIGKNSGAGSTTLTVASSDANADAVIVPKGTGTLKAGGSHTANIGENDDLITFEYAENNYGFDKSNLTFSNVDESITGAWTFAGNVTFQGDLIVTGTTIEVDSQISTADAVIDLNDGEAGSGVTLGYSGLLVDRGTADDFWFGFDETRDFLTAGTVSALADVSTLTKRVALMADNPLNDQIARWDSVNNRIKFENVSSVIDVNYDEDPLIPISSETGFTYTSNLKYESDVLFTPAATVSNVNISGSSISTLSGDMDITATSGTINILSGLDIASNSISNTGNTLVLNGSNGSIVANSADIGNIDILGNGITTSSGDITLSSSSGTVILSGDTVNIGSISYPLSLGTAGQVLTVVGSALQFSDLPSNEQFSFLDEDSSGNVFNTASGNGYFQYADLRLVSGNIASQNATMSIGATDNTSGIVIGEQITLTSQGSSKVVIDGISMPKVDGSANQVLVTDGNGVLSFADQASPLSAGTHIDITSDVISVTTGTSANQILQLDANALVPSSVINGPSVTVSTGDLITIQDLSDSNNLKTVTVQGILDLVPAGSSSVGFPGALNSADGAGGWVDTGIVAAASTIIIGAESINESLITSWNQAFSWGDHAGAGYLFDAPADGNNYVRNNNSWVQSASLNNIEDGPGNTLLIGSNQEVGDISISARGNDTIVDVNIIAKSALGTVKIGDDAGVSRLNLTSSQVISDDAFLNLGADGSAYFRIRSSRVEPGNASVMLGDNTTGWAEATITDIHMGADASTGTTRTIDAVGTEANIDINLTPKGSGNVIIPPPSSSTTLASGDLLMVFDIDDSNNPKQVTAQSIADLVFSSGQSLFPNGTISEPSVAFSNLSGSGLYTNGSSLFDIVYQGSARLRFDSGGTDLRNNLNNASNQQIFSSGGVPGAGFQPPSTSVTAAADDKVFIFDTSDVDNPKQVTAQSIADLASVSTSGSGTDSLVLGPDATAAGDNSVSLGHNASASGNQGVAIGFGATANIEDVIAIGDGAGDTGGTVSNRSISIGNGANGLSNNVGFDAIAIGTATQSVGNASIAFGDNADALSNNSIGIGEAVESNGVGSISIGTRVTASAQGAINMGYHTSAQDNAVSDSFKLMWDGNVGFWTGLTIGTAVTSNNDPDTNLTDAVDGVIAYDSTDHEFRSYENGSWAKLVRSKSHIWAEENGSFNPSTNSGFQFSFGNGATSTNGMTIGYDATGITLTLSSSTSTTGTVELYKNSVATGHTISLTAQTSNTVDITESIAKGDRISFRTTSGSGGGQIVVGLVIEST